MQVQVVDLLSAMGIAVDDQTVAVLGDAFLARDLGGDHEQVSEQRLVGRRDVVGGRDRLDRHDQHVGRRARVDVAEGDHALVPIDDIGRQFALDDALEQCRHVDQLKISPQWSTTDEADPRVPAGAAAAAPAARLSGVGRRSVAGRRGLRPDPCACARRRLQRARGVLHRARRLGLGRSAAGGAVAVAVRTAPHGRDPAAVRQGRRRRRRGAAATGGRDRGGSAAAGDHRQARARDRRQRVGTGARGARRLAADLADGSRPAARVAAAARTRGAPVDGRGSRNAAGRALRGQSAGGTAGDRQAGAAVAARRPCRRRRSGREQRRECALRRVSAGRGGAQRRRRAGAAHPRRSAGGRYRAAAGAVGTAA